VTWFKTLRRLRAYTRCSTYITLLYICVCTYNSRAFIKFVRMYLRVFCMCMCVCVCVCVYAFRLPFEISTENRCRIVETLKIHTIENHSRKIEITTLHRIWNLVIVILRFAKLFDKFIQYTNLYNIQKYSRLFSLTYFYFYRCMWKTLR